MSTTEPTNEQPKHIDEDEAALYDRQIRLWGVEAQNRMKTASVLLVHLRGLASEVAKNIVLAGIGRLTLLDAANVHEEDLGSGYFLREEDIGRNRAVAACPRIQNLNPRVQVDTLSDLSILNNESLLSQFNLVCLTDSDYATMNQVDQLCRKINTKFYAASSLGLSGYIFADLLDHEYTVERPDPKVKVEPGTQRPLIPMLKKQCFVPFEAAMHHTWTNAKPKLRQKQLAQMMPLFGSLAALEFQRQNKGALPTLSDDKQLVAMAQQLLKNKGVDPSCLDASQIEMLASSATADFSASCAVIGGVLAQDVLNALGGKEAPVANFFQFDGFTNSGNIYALGLQRT